MPQHTRPYANILETIGRTPLVRLNRVTQGIRTPVYAKAEFFNPGGSVKDRIGLAMIEAAEREGRLKPGGLIVEATSGNTGVGLALAAAVKGYRCIFTMPDKMSQEKARLLHALGAEVIITPTALPPDHPDNYIMKGRAIAAAHPNAIFADQHYNPVNPDVHYHTTGPEIWEQTQGHVTHFVCAPGTGGTVSGAGRYLKERNPKVRVIVDDPEALLVTVLCDTGERYLSKVYNDEWLRENEILESERVTVAHLLVAKNGTAAPPLVSVAPSATVRQALNLMSTYNVSQLPVLDGGDGVGAVFEQVLMTKALEDHSLLDQPVEALMDPPFPVVDADVPVDRLSALLSRETPAALVRREGKLAGIVTRYDLLHQLAGIH